MKNIYIILFTLLPISIFSQDVNIPDANFLKALLFLGIDTNDDGIIQYTEAEVVDSLKIHSYHVSNLEGIHAFVNLKKLICEDISLTNLDLTNNTALTYLVCRDNSALTNLDLSNNTALTYLDCSNIDLTNLDLSNNKELTYLDCNWNDLTNLDLTNNTALTYLNCSLTKLTNLELSNKTALTYLDCENNDLTNLDLSNNTALTYLDCSGNDLTSLDLSNNTALTYLVCSGNDLTSLDLSNNTALTYLDCGHIDLKDLDLSSNTALTHLDCRWNDLTNLDLSNNTALIDLDCSGNDLTNLNLSNNTALIDLECSVNDLTNLNLSNNTALIDLGCSHNDLTNLDLSNNTALIVLNCIYNDLTILDLSNNPLLVHLFIGSNQLEFLNIHNGGSITFLALGGFPEITVICLDEEEYDYVHNVTETKNVILLTDCNAAFEGVLYDVTGNINFGLDSLCNTSIEQSSGLHFNIDNGSEIIYKPIYNQDGYLMKLPQDTYGLSLILENTELFDVNPKIADIVLDSMTNPYLQDFCLSPKNELVVDANIIIVPIDLARPGFDVDYKVIYENKGNIISNGTLEIEYPEFIGTFLSSTPTVIDDGSKITLNYQDLTPFEKRELYFTMKLNSPMDDPPLVGGLINYTASIFPNEAEHYEPDNYFVLIQDVVNSYDPNDKTCLQGNTLLDEMIGEYVHYHIRFENEGTASAVNVIIEDQIDPASFDISTLRIEDSSDPVYLRIKDNNAKFIFENIYLPFDESDNKGYVTYKVKTWPNLEVGDSLKNTANIFFDFNFPIRTNTTFTEIVTDMDGDGFNNIEDCDDSNPDINPQAEEITYNGLDDDCDPATLDDDLDQDGFILDQDCDDSNPDINPQAEEITYNGLDDDCDPATLDDDLDQDGFILDQDCDDNNPDINPQTEEITYNGLDDDCDPVTLDDDLDQDGFILDQDCNDNNPDINPQAEEITYNGLDDDCDPVTLDDDLDQDGFILDQDCDDNNPDINPQAEEIAYNGLDDDCDPATLDDDLDQDGFILDQDCDDNNPDINPEAEEIANNGIDEDCDGADLVIAIHKLSDIELNIYPNPSIDVINIEFDSPLEYSVELYNLNGVLLKQGNNLSSLNVLNIQRGMYLLKIQDIATKQMIVQKIVIE